MIFWIQIKQKSRGKEKAMEHSTKNYLLSSFVLVFVLCFVNPARSDAHQPYSSKHFVLVHGAADGAWCWYKLAPLLRSSGHNVTTFDLAASGVNPKQVLDVPFVSQFFMPLIDFMASLPHHEKVILVGHSYSGLGISLAMEKFPEKISVAVFLVALMPSPRTNYSELVPKVLESQGDTMDSYFTFGNGPNNPPTSFIVGPKYMASNIYQLSPVEDWTLGTTLVRQFHVYSIEDLTNTIKLTDKNYGSVNRVYIQSDESKVVKKYIQDWIIKQNPPNEVRLVKNSDHMVMMSRPKKLASQLLNIAKKFY